MNKTISTSLGIIIIVIVAGSLFGGVFVYNYYWQKQIPAAQQQIKPTACAPNWQCGWGPCTNGYQSQVAVDSNNCGLPASSSGIACPALARQCTPSAQPSITVASPNGGETLKQGQTYNIAWSSTGVNKVDIYAKAYNYSHDCTTACSLSPNGSCCSPCVASTIAKGVSASLGQYSWTIPSTQDITSMGKIIIQSSAGEPCNKDTSDSYFSIVAP